MKYLLYHFNNQFNFQVDGGVNVRINLSRAHSLSSRLPHRLVTAIMNRTELN